MLDVQSTGPRCRMAEVKASRREGSTSRSPTRVGAGYRSEQGTVNMPSAIGTGGERAAAIYSLIGSDLLPWNLVTSIPDSHVPDRLTHTRRKCPLMKRGHR